MEGGRGGIIMDKSVVQVDNDIVIISAQIGDERKTCTKKLLLHHLWS